jgi:hypothetical protein
VREAQPIDPWKERFEMATELVWSPCRWGKGVDALGETGLLYIVMSFPATLASPGWYLASHRVSFCHDPHYLGRFPFSPEGMEAAQAACQTLDDSSGARFPEHFRISPSGTRLFAVG